MTDNRSDAANTIGALTAEEYDNPYYQPSGLPELSLDGSEGYFAESSTLQESSFYSPDVMQPADAEDYAEEVANATAYFRRLIQELRVMTHARVRTCLLYTSPSPRDS